MKLLLFACAVTLLGFTACNNEPKTAEASSFSLDSVKTHIAASNAVYGDCFAKNDSTTFVGCYTSDACINPAGVPKICGSAGINAFFGGAVKMGIKKIVLTTAEVMGGKDGVIETGSYDLQGDGGVSYEKGKFIVMWKEEGGKWKMHRDIWNSDAPAPPPPPAPVK